MMTSCSMKRLLWRLALIVPLQLAAWAGDASAHTLTVYQTVLGDDSSVHGYSDLWEHDPPSGCDGETDHYQTWAILNGPSGSTYNENTFNAHVSLPAVDGDFTLDGQGAVGCSCHTETIYALAVFTFFKVTTTYLEYTQTSPEACHYGAQACTSGSPSCITLPTTVFGAPQPCASYRRVRYLKFTSSGNCYDFYSTGTPTSGACT